MCMIYMCPKGHHVSFDLITTIVAFPILNYTFRSWYLTSCCTGQDHLLKLADNR